MTRLDHNRALSALAIKMNCSLLDIENFCIWGNHSPTMFPDTFNSKINGKNLHQLIDHKWRVEEFIPKV